MRNRIMPIPIPVPVDVFFFDSMTLSFQGVMICFFDYRQNRTKAKATTDPIRAKMPVTKCLPFSLASSFVRPWPPWTHGIRFVVAVSARRALVIGWVGAF